MFGKMFRRGARDVPARSGLRARGAWKVFNAGVGSGLLRAGTSRASGAGVASCVRWLPWQNRHSPSDQGIGRTLHYTRDSK
jgi:hypothetical protein